MKDGDPAASGGVGPSRRLHALVAPAEPQRDTGHHGAGAPLKGRVCTSGHLLVCPRRSPGGHTRPALGTRNASAENQEIVTVWRPSQRTPPEDAHPATCPRQPGHSSCPRVGGGMQPASRNGGKSQGLTGKSRRWRGALGPEKPKVLGGRCLTRSQGQRKGVQSSGWRGSMSTSQDLSRDPGQLGLTSDLSLCSCSWGCPDASPKHMEKG